MIGGLLFNRIPMAIKDPNVLNRVNALNENLENANITEVQRNISTRLFNALEWGSSISVDSELYNSINDVTNASDISRRISDIILDSAINVNAIDIRGTDPSTLPHGDATETQNSIDRITNAENDLTTLESNIANLKSRLGENISKLTDIADEQHIIGGVARWLSIIDGELTSQNNLKWRINTISWILSRIINELNKTGGWDAGVLSSCRTQFTAVEKGWIPISLQSLPTLNTAHLGDIENLQSQYVTLLNDTNNRIEELNHEKNLRNRIDWLNKTPIHIQNWFLPFGDTWTVASAWWNEGLTRWFIANFNGRLTQLNNLQTEIPHIRTRYMEHKSRLDRILQLQKLQDRLNAVHPGEMRLRQRELQAISDISYNNLLLWPQRTWWPLRPAYQPNLPNTNITIWWTPTVVPLNFVHAPLVWARSFNYTLCGSDGNPLRTSWGNFEYQLWDKTLSIWWISFVNNNIANQNMNINNLTITPIEWLTFPLNLDLNVRVRIHDNDTWLDVDHHKPIHLEITRPTLLQANREAAYDSLIPPMDERITAEYTDRYRENLENEAIWRILREWWNEAEVNEIYNNETRRNLFIDRVRNRLRWHFPFLAIGNLQAWFRGDMTRENRDVPVQYLLNQNAFQNYVRQSIPDNLRNYASWQINNNANVYRNDILQEFLDFQTDVSNNPKDNTDNLRVLAQIPDDAHWPQSHPDSRWQRLRRRNSRRNNYTKFFQWRNANLENQTLETEDWEIKYWVNIEVLWVNRIVATINIDGKEEPEIIEAANHDRLIRWILNRANTKDGEPLNRKLRCNIALSVLKSMVMISPQKLSREIPATNFVDARWNNVTCDRIEAFIKWENLIIRGRWVNPATRTTQRAIIFDENQFKNLHDIDTLENWVRELSTQINTIMNATAQEYQNATNWLLHNWENRNLLKYNTTQWLRWWPIKRLRWRIVHGKTNNNFDFETSVNDAWKNVNIAFNNWKFTVTGEFDGQEYSYEAKDLWSILRKKINRKRIFDWIELAMVAAINEEYVNRLRTNNLVQTENFAVSDLNNDKTWKIYIFDEDGNLSYLEIEDRALNPLWGRNAGRFDSDTIPTERIRCNAQERIEFFQNPLLAWRLLREMRRRLALW